MSITIKVTPRKIHLFIVIILVLWFFYMVPLHNGFGVPFPSGTKELYEQVGPEAAILLAHENPEFIMTETMIAVFHQYAVGCGGPIHQRWLWAAMIITVSGFLWAAVICFVCVPKGYWLKEGNVVEHMAFSAVLATISLLQILQSLRSDPKDFFWIPWFIVVLVTLIVRAFSRIRRCNRSIQDELLFHLPWIIGLIVPHAIWFEPFASMNYGYNIMLPISLYYVNSYTVIMNLIVISIATGFIPQIKKIKERNL